MAKYAAETSVSSERSLMEIKQTVTRYGASGFSYAESPTVAMVQFEVEGRRVRFVLPMPDRNAPEFTRTPHRRALRSKDQQLAAYEQAVRQRWRALALAIKAKLEAVESGIATFETEFLGYVVLPGGETVGEWIAPQLAEAIESGKMPPMLPMPQGRED